MKTYIISSSEYMGMPDSMYEFKGTFRALLEELNGVTEENRDVLTPDDPQDSRRFPMDFSDKELTTMFDAANGDGQPFYMVWCVEDGKKVL